MPDLLERKHRLMREREDAVKRLEQIPREKEALINEANAGVQALDAEYGRLGERIIYLAGMVDGMDEAEVNT